MFDWYVGRLGDLATGIRGVTYTPDQLLQVKSQKTFTLLRANNIQGNRLLFSDTQIVPEYLVSPGQEMRVGDLAVCMSNGSKALVGKAASLVNDIGEKLTVGAFCSIFRPAEDAVPAFVQYLFQTESYRKQLELSLAGSAISNLSNSALESFSIYVPPRKEQEAIASALGTIDAVISHTEAIIAKLKQVKQGLLHDLLTRGIDANGELRRSPVEAPDLYIATRTGLAPKSWREATVGGVISGGPRNGIYKQPSDIGAGTLLVGQTAITAEGSLDFSFARRARLLNAELGTFGLREGDILVSRVFATREGVGQPALVPSMDEPAVYESNMMRLRVREGIVDPKMLFHLLQHRSSRAWLMSRAFASNQASINSETIGSVPLSLPPEAEEAEILHVLTQFETRLHAEQVCLLKAEALKSGLMDDLLTGRVRVTPLLST